MSGRTLLLLILALIAGILAGQLNFVMAWMAALPLCAAIVCFLVSIRRRRRNPLRLNPALNEVMAGLLFLGVGIFSSAINRPSIVDFAPGKYRFSGEVQDYTATSGGDRTILKVNSLAAIDADGRSHPLDVSNLNLLLTLRDVSGITYGSIVTGLCSLTPLDAKGNFLNDDYTAYLRTKGIHAFATANPGDFFVARGKGSLFTWFRGLRDDIVIAVERTGLATPTKDFLISTLLGDKSHIKAADRFVFADAGMSHIFAVSGFHVSMVALFVLGFFSLAFHGRYGRLKFLLCIPAVWFFILLVGASAASCRAGIMITIGMTALFLQRKNDPLRALGWAVLLILAFSPAALFDAGFQLSVVCVGSLLLIAAPLNFINHRSHPLLFRLVSAILVTLVATFSTWLICAFYFHRFSLMFLPLNLVALPLLPFFILFAILYVVFYHAGLDIHFLSDLLDASFLYFHNAAERLTSLSYTFTSLHPGALTVWLWMGALVLLCLVLNRTRPLRRLWVPALLFCMALVSLPLVARENPRGLIFQKNSRAISLMVYDSGKESQVTLPSGTASSTVICGRKVVVLNGDISSFAALPQLLEAEYILLTERVRTLPDDLESLRSDCVFVTHPTMHWRNERNVIASLQSQRRTIHSLRYSGPLHVFD